MSEPTTEPISPPQPFVINGLDDTVFHIIDEQDENDSDFHLYHASTEDDDCTLYLAFASLVTLVALASITSKFNSILDSGCTMHIIKNKQFFWTYHLKHAVPVETTNCGTLYILAHSDVKFLTHIDRKTVILVLKDCLHAPDVSINLLSVGLMVENDMKLMFEKDSTSLFFPSTLKHLGSKSITATVYKKLLFIFCDFMILPVNDDLSFSALSNNTVLFPKVLVTPELWHRHMRHPAQKTTQMMLTKNFATGVDYSGKFEHLQCIPCIVGKQPA